MRTFSLLATDVLPSVIFTHSPLQSRHRTTLPISGPAMPHALVSSTLTEDKSRALRQGWRAQTRIAAIVLAQDADCAGRKPKKSIAPPPTRFLPSKLSASRPRCPARGLPPRWRRILHAHGAFDPVPLPLYGPSPGRRLVRPPASAEGASGWPRALRQPLRPASTPG